MYAQLENKVLFHLKKNPRTCPDESTAFRSLRRHWMFDKKNGEKKIFELRDFISQMTTGYCHYKSVCRNHVSNYILATLVPW